MLKVFLTVLAMMAGVLAVALVPCLISLQAQLVLSFAVLGLMFESMSRPDNRTMRLMTFVFAGIFALRYAFWRTTETLPSIDEP